MLLRSRVTIDLSRDDPLPFWLRAKPMMDWSRWRNIIVTHILINNRRRWHNRSLCILIRWRGRRPKMIWRDERTVRGTTHIGRLRAKLPEQIINDCIYMTLSWYAIIHTRTMRLQSTVRILHVLIKVKKLSIHFFSSRKISRPIFLGWFPHTGLTNLPFPKFLMHNICKRDIII